MKSDKIAMGALTEGDLPLNVRAEGKVRRWNWRRMVLGALVVAGITGALIWPRIAPLIAMPETRVAAEAVPDQTVQTDSVVAALGHLEPAGGVVAVTPPRGSRDATVSAILVTSGADVRRGDALAVLETLSRAEGALAQADAEVAMRLAELARARRAVTAGKAETEAQIALVRTRLDGAARALTRGDQLIARDALTPAKLEELQTAHDALADELTRAEAQRVRLYGPVEDHPDVMAARGALAAAEAARLLAETDVDEATVRAPADGRIVAIPTRLGEPAPADGLMRLAVEGPMVAVLEVHQDQAHLVQTGAPVTLQSPAFVGELTGRVVQVGIEVQRQAVFSADPAANSDARVFEVRVQLDPAASAVARHLINLQVLASIATGSGS
jgi:HlyD family secretion protein